MNKLLFTITLLLFTVIVSAQNITVKGQILEKGTNLPLEYATVVFKDTTDPSNINGGITDASGNYEISVPTGTYTISFEYIGFKTVSLKNQNLNKSQTLTTQYLFENAESLDEVSIIAEKTTVEIKLDKKIYNVGKDLTVRGGTVSDVLDNVPSVSVDVEGNVALRGNENVRILINGKPSGLVGLSGSDALRQLPAESIEKVEVITSPSARYDSEGTAGILNIILRRSKLQGLNGAVNTNVGYNPRAGISGNINYRTGNVNIFNTTGYSYRENPGNWSTSTRRYNETYDDNGLLILDEPDTYLDETKRFNRLRKGFNTNLGIEWYVNDSASLTTSIFYRDNENRDNTNNVLEQFDENKILTSTSTRFDPEIADDRTIQYSTNFTKNFETSGHKLSLDFQFEDTSEDEDSPVLVNNILSEQVNTFSDETRLLLQGDYVLPIGEKHQFEAGFRGNFNNTNTDYQVRFLNTSGTNFVLDRGLSNELLFREYLYAAYTQFGSKIGKFSYLLGLRLENTQITINQKTTADLTKKNYTGLFPTLNFSYELSDNENITLGYARRLRRPRSFFINPFPSRSSVTSVFQGNPNLDPSYSGQFDLGYYKKFGKLSVNGSTYYSHATDVFSFQSFDNGETVTVNGETLSVIQRTPINLDTEDRLGAEFTLTYNPSKKWRINANYNFFRNTIKGNSLNGLSLNNSNNQWFARLSNKYTLPYSIDWQTNLFYRGPREDAQTKTDGLFNMTLAFSKDLFKEKASITFNINDVFNSRKRYQYTTTPTFEGSSEFQWSERSFNLAFTYRFNQKKKRERNGGFGSGDMEG
ncbi:TonB-dependent receptor domain-containing protein [Aurantibacter sp.]|uniref:TonB-dependent receptor domain-containing protein n=1 Tax=Aurantibacter sp. TaxID=2807103 RepID=UPI0035C7BE7A